MLHFIKCFIHSINLSYFRLRLAKLGANTQINMAITLSYPKAISIGHHCHISRNVSLHANTDNPTGIRIGNHTSLHESVLIAANQGYVEIGDRSWLAPFCLIYGNGGVSIGNDVLIAPRVSINTVSHHAEHCDQPINEQGIYCDPVIIEDDVWIGMHAVILQGVTIGQGAIIGASAVVNRDIPAWGIALGIPAKVRSYRKNAPQPQRSNLLDME